MKKIPTLFKRVFEDNKLITTLPVVTDGLEDVLHNGVATVKWDGACCAVINGVFYRRYDAKHGKPIPQGAIKCQEEADLVTGHLPCWVQCDRNNPDDKWFWSAYDNAVEQNDGKTLKDGTYEAVGRHFNGNPYKMSNDTLKPHGVDIVAVNRTFEGVMAFLRNNDIEGIVFWLNGEPRAKIKRTDLGFSWNESKV